ncbi:penicillin-binding transpeptidase domain-containing protein [Streptosporangium lutulentum]
MLVKAEQAPILAADGTRIDTPDAPGSVQQLVEGLKERYGSRLTGTSSARVDLLQGTERVATLATAGAKAGEELRTTVDLRVHRAAAKALDAVDKPASLVALRPSTGEILAVVNKPGGFNRALLGQYPPGSTFKVVTASALIADGMTADEACPARPSGTSAASPSTTPGSRTTARSRCARRSRTRATPRSGS